MIRYSDSSVIRVYFCKMGVVMRVETVKISSLSTGFNNWFFFMSVVLAGYWLLLKAGSPLAYNRMPEPVELTNEICISLENVHHQPEVNKKPLRVNIKKSRKFQQIIDQAADRYEVDPYLIRAVIMAESGYNPKAVSNKGARGLMQLMPRTAKAMGVEDSFNPAHNVNGGVRYLKKLLNRYDGNVELALAAYNAGSRKVHKYQGVPPFKATRLYIQKVNDYFLFYRNYMNTGLNKV
jgi:hypothetical protein